ncbi:MAG: phosphopantothenoylcysteine decarboxylase/phosphopantothenate--cysteine ligase [Candidatus Omnitrophota bacterium]
MKKLKIVVACGPTREPIDPVRFISNRSTGEFGIEIAKQYIKNGHTVTLVHGPIAIPPRIKSKKIGFETTKELQTILKKEAKTCDILFMVAAVSDYRLKNVYATKLKRGEEKPTFDMAQNPDVIRSLNKFKKKNAIHVAFSVETNDIEIHARRKLKEKKVDLIVAQLVSARKQPFGNVNIDSMFIRRTGEKKIFKNMSKQSLAKHLAGEVEAIVDSD